MEEFAPEAGAFDYTSGALALDFVNTLSGRYDEEPRDQIRSYDELLSFARGVDCIDAADTGALAQMAMRAADDAARAWQDALHVREVLFSIFASVAAGHTPRQSDLSKIGPSMVRAAEQRRLQVLDGQVVLGWEPVGDVPAFLERPLWPIVQDAVDLLIHGQLDRVRECAADDCGWLFIDATRNRSRRWCSMQTCGNRAKVSNFRARKRE
ncbi:MAG: CGNR zinc finger domain-containing protein [Thermomicrobiales bacterium]|nr:CGNR zinc finger domain-containing protein [Thermomicrobiales bacterium]